MIEAITELFVERVPPRPRTLAPATRLLVVDAAGHAERLREVFTAVEDRLPLSVSLIALADLGQGVVAFDVIWLVAGAGGDPAYCALIHGELEARFPGASVELLVVGADIDAAALRGGPSWRRRAAVRCAADSLAERLAR